MSECLAVELAIAGDRATVSGHGEMDLSNSNELKTALEGAVQSGRRVVVDLRDVTFIDSATLMELCAAAKRLSAQDRKLKVIASGESLVLRKLVIKGLPSILDVTWEDAY